MLSPGPGACAETAGFLFSHPCKNPAIQACGTCGKAICASHLRLEGVVPTCVTCSRDHGESSHDDPYDYSTGVYSDYRSYDRWDRYRRRPAGEDASSDAGVDATGFADGQDWGPDTGAPTGTAKAVYGDSDDSGWESDFDAS